MSNSRPGDYADQLRIDVGFEVVKDPHTGADRIFARFDPTRYHIAERNGVPMLVDRFDHWAMPLNEARRMITAGLARCATGQSPRIRDTHAYIAERRAYVRNRLAAEYPAPPYQHVDQSEDYLASISDGAYGFAVLSVDIVGSTMLSTSLDCAAYSRIIGVVLEELATAAPLFHAHILKFTGDGILGYLPAGSFLTANDNAIDCALTMRGLVRDAINPALTELGHPLLNVRIGIESGEATVQTVGAPTSKQHRDLIGRTLNVACKVQASGKPGEIRIGQIAYQNMHTMWKLGCKPAELPSAWPYSLPGGRPHLIHLFVEDGAVVSPPSSKPGSVSE